MVRKVGAKPINRREFFKYEYPVVAESWRFFTGIRFALMTFAATLLFALLGGYQYVLDHIDKLGYLGQTARWAIPVFGIVNTFAVIMIESRTRTLYGTCLERGLEIERQQSIDDGLFRKVWNRRPPLGFGTHTLSIRII